MSSVTHESVNHLLFDNVPLSLGCVEISVPPRFFLTYTPRSTSVLAWIVSHMLPLLSGIVQTGFCLALLGPFNVVEHRHECDPIFIRLWMSTVQVRLLLWTCFLMSRVKAPGNTCQMKCTSRAAEVNFVAHPSVIVPFVMLNGSGFEIPTHSVESENTWTFILINFAAGSLSNVILDQRHGFQSCHTSILYASLRSISACTCRYTDCNIFLCSDIFVHRHSFEVLVILA